MARARRVSRQRIQALVNPLLELQLVESVSKAASKRSPLIRLTKAGADAILGMRRLKRREMNVALSDRKLLDATNTRSKLRTGLEAGREVCDILRPLREDVR